MRIIEIKNKGSIAFPEGVIWKPGDDTKIAIIGNNGSGKTTLIDTICMAFFGMTPNRKSESGREDGAIYGCFKSKDSVIEVKALINGKEIHVKRLINPNSKTQKPYLYVNGKAVTEGKVKEFNEEFVKATGLTQEIFLATVYHAQKGKGHLSDLEQGSARALLDQLLGFGEYDREFQLIDVARLQLEKEISMENASLKELELRVAHKPTLDAELDQYKKEKVQVEKDLSEVDKSLKVATQHLADLKSGSMEVRELMDKKQSINSEIARLNNQIAELVTRKENNSKLLSQSDAIRKAAKDLEDLNQLIQSKEQELAKAKTQSETEAESIRLKIIAVKEEYNGYSSTLQQLNLDKNSKKDLQSANKSSLSVLESTLKQLESTASLLDRVPCKDVTVGDKILVNECELLKNAVEGKNKVQSTKDSMLDKTKVQESLELEIKILEDKIIEVSLAMENLSKGNEKLQDELSNLPSALQVKSLDKELVGLRSTIPILQEGCKFLAQLELAQEKIDDYTSQINDLKVDLDKKIQEFEQNSELIESKLEESKAIENAEIEVKKFEQTRTSILSIKDQLIAYISKTEEKLSEIDIASNRIQKIKNSPKSEKLRGLKLLAEGLSPKGVRALKLDAAGPGISAEINGILAECYGTRFQVSLRTTRETGKGDLKEEISLTVLDEETGIETLLENKSGGEEAIIKEGVSLGAAVYKQRQTGSSLKTLIRDEADGGLTSENAHLYQKMLDKAMVVGGFEQVIYISHKPEIQYLANRIDKVESGKVIVGIK